MVMNFKRFLINSRYGDSLEGDFVRDALRDKNFPNDFKDFDSLKRHLLCSRACPEAIECGEQVFKDYKSRNRRNVSLRLRFYIMQRDGHTCQTCGAYPPEARLEVDHKIPLSKGGSNDEENLWTLCFECNRGKADIHIS